MGRLNELGLHYGTDKASNDHNFLDFYEQNLPPSSKAIRLLEVGTYEGASLAMWRDFYPNADIVGVDIRDSNGIEGVTELTMNTRDVYALKKLGKFDVILDDGSHMQLDQQVFMQFALDYMLKEDGIFIMEDLHCCYWDIMQDGSKQTTEEVIKEMEESGKWYVKYFIHEDKTQNYTAIIKKNGKVKAE